MLLVTCLICFSLLVCFVILIMIVLIRYCCWNLGCLFTCYLVVLVYWLFGLWFACVELNE